jgi:hypothetical protein
MNKNLLQHDKSGSELACTIIKKGGGRREKKRSGGGDRKVTGSSAAPGPPSLWGQFSAFR